MSAGPPQTIQDTFDALKKHCEAVGRDYESIRRTLTLSCMIGETDEQAEAKVPAVLRSRAVMTSALIGSPATLHKRLIELEETGVQEIILRFSDVLNLDVLSCFAAAKRRHKRVRQQYRFFVQQKQVEQGYARALTGPVDSRIMSGLSINVYPWRGV